MDIVIKGRRMEVSDRFRTVAAEKLAKVEKWDAGLQRVDVEVSKETNPRLADRAFRVELTCRSRGPVIRAEAAAEDKLAALDLAIGRLEARMRRAADRRTDWKHRHDKTTAPAAPRGARGADAVGGAVGRRAAGPRGAAGLDPARVPGGGTASDGDLAIGLGSDLDSDLDSDLNSDVETDRDFGRAPGRAPGAGPVIAEGPMVVREKTHEATPMSLDQALYEMELVGHDFFLFVDAGSHRPSVVYRRRGYDYGVIRLAVTGG